MRDLHFIAGDYLFGDIPPSHDYLRYYFDSDLEQKFLSYFVLFGEYYNREGFLRFYHNFMDHTGHFCSTRWLRKLIKKYNDIEQALKNASSNFNLEMVSKIKSGLFFNRRQYHQ